jgi:hypothetical protein
MKEIFSLFVRALLQFITDITGKPYGFLLFLKIFF